MIYLPQIVLRNERAMLRWMLKLKAEDHVRLLTICEQLNLPPLESNLKFNRLRWYACVNRNEKWISKCTHLEIDGRRRPHKTRSETMTEDMKAWNIDVNNVPDRPVWKKALKTAMKSLTCSNRGQVAQNG